MRKIAISLGILILAIIVSVLLVTLSPDPPRRPPNIQAPLVQTVLLDSRSGVLEVAGSGTVRPRAQVAIAPQVSGKVVYVSPALVSGGRVQEGQLLAQIEQADYENALRQAEADVAQQQVNLMQAEEEATIARQEYERYQQREADRRSFDAYASIDENDFAARIGGAERVDAEPAATGQDPGSLVLRVPQQRAAAAALARAEAVLKDAQLAFNRTRIVAPFAGYIRSESIDEGQFITQGQVIAEIYAANEIEVVVPLSTDEASMIPELWNKQPDRDDLLIPAHVLMGYGGQTYRWDAYVHRAEAALDPTTRTVDVVVRVPQPFDGGVVVQPPGEMSLLTNQSPPLLVGQYTSVRIEGSEMDQYYVIPRRALRVNDQIWTIKDDSLLHIKPIQVLQKVGDEVFIVGELDMNTEVVVSDLSAATENMKVRPNRVTTN